MEKTKTFNDVAIFICFNIVFSALAAYLIACLVLHNVQPNNHRIFYDLKVLLFKSITLFNNNSGGIFDNPGADVFIYAIVTFICSLAIIFALFRQTSKRRNVVDNFSSEIHGNAAFANTQEISKSGLTSNQSGVVLAQISNKQNKSVKLINSETKHVFIIGGTGDSKTTGPMICSLLSVDKKIYMQDKYALSSALIFDLKGSIYQKTAGWAHENGIRLFVLNPMDPRFAQFNIFNEIDIHKPTFTDTVEKIVQVIMDPSGKNYSGDKFWEEQGRVLLASIIVFRMLQNKDKKIKTNLRDIAYLFRGYDYNDKCQYSLQSMFEDMKNCDHDYVRSAGFMYDSTVEKTLAGYISTAQNALNLFVSDTLGEVTADSTFRLRDLFYRYDVNGNPLSPAWLYLSVPYEELARLEPFIQLITTFYLRELTREEDEALEKKYPTRIFGDEFAKMGRFEEIGEYLGMLRGYGGIMVLLTQSLKDIEKVYGKNNTILSNCTYLVVLGVQKTDPDTANTIATATGFTTVHEVMPSVNIKKGKGVLGLEEKTYSYAPHLHKKLLMEANEITNMPSDECIIIAKGISTIKAKKIRYFEDPELTRRSQIPAPDYASLKKFMLESYINDESNLLKTKNKVYFKQA